MTGKKKFFLDTAPIIYFLENDKTFGSIVLQKIENIVNNRNLLVISSLCYGEYLTIPFRNNDSAKEKNFYKFIKDLNIIVYDINIDIMKQAAKLRAKYKGLKMPDAIQLATAKCTGCVEFITNDKELKEIAEVSCVVLSEL